LLRIPKNSIQADKNYPVAEFNHKIKIHNSTLKFPKKSEFLMEKAAFLEWRAYNTPNAKDVSISPLHGGFYPHIDFNDKSPLNIYNQWKVSSFMLILEYNILNSAKIYMDNLDFSPILPSHYKDSLEIWKNRQIEFNLENPDLFKQNTYIRDFSVDMDHLYVEICEDFLYVMLNILLAKRIVDEINIKEYIDIAESEFYSKLKSVILLHCEEYDEYYRCLNSIRISYIDNYVTESELKLVQKIIYAGKKLV
jgi:hypothetical protein